jgi:hypothetical protein
MNNAARRPTNTIAYGRDILSESINFLVLPENN